MSEHLAWFEDARGTACVALPFELEEVLADWSALRSRMARELPDAFQRDEWAYLLSFLERGNLLGAFVQGFGAPTDERTGVRLLARPRGPVAIWLPNNVSLLGPLALVLLSLTGNELLLKGGSQSQDLTGAFLAFATQHLAPGALKRHLTERVRYEVFDRADARNAEYARRAVLRIVFGSDQAAEAIEALPHPLDSSSCAFVDRRSEAWVSAAALDEALLETLLKVFAIYGQAGCTSPRRVVLLDGNEAEARDLRDRLVSLWGRVVKGEPAQHVASSSILGGQWARALGWDVRLAPRNAAVLAAGALDLAPFEAPMGLPVVAASVERAAETLPENIQTIGHAVGDPTAPRWLELMARLRAKRFVPLARMHHFGPVWDGIDFWRRSFEEVELSP